ncbi:hypothetical protein JKP88DRAFT_227595 [Tribonema minus]|uniref:Uncharacterized protein n=1 Tax=Tribonema minus TaxID=303371 RepID=A0A836C8K6_9STRA|nr:hypothetical protein JKP88DRAFT_227595 [Tribonema minus]
MYRGAACSRCSGRAACHGRICLHHHTPCSSIAACCARKCPTRSNPCTCGAPGRVGKCPTPHSPYSGRAACRAHICPRHHTPYNNDASCRAGISPHHHSPCTQHVAGRAGTISAASPVAAAWHLLRPSPSLPQLDLQRCQLKCVIAKHWMRQQHGGEGCHARDRRCASISSTA